MEALSINKLQSDQIFAQKHNNLSLMCIVASRTFCYFSKNVYVSVLVSSRYNFCKGGLFKGGNQL